MNNCEIEKINYEIYQQNRVSGIILIFIVVFVALIFGITTLINVFIAIYHYQRDESNKNNN